MDSASAAPRYTGSILFPPRPPSFRAGGAGNFSATGQAGDRFSIDAQGYGSITGLGYTVPAHSDADFDIDLKVLSLTSNDVTNLNNLIQGMVGASNWQKVRDYESTHASANLSYWGFLGGGGGASYEKTHELQSGFGLSEENQRTIVSAMSEIAKNMSRVAVKVHVKNSANSYAVSGNMIVYTISGTVTSNNKQYQYRMIADQGLAGSGDQTAPTDNNVTPLN
jgi:hypothetical protein